MISEKDKIEAKKKTEAWAADWKARGCPEITDEEVEDLYIDLSELKEFGETMYYHGVLCPIEQIVNHKWNTVSDILKEKNMEVRRVLISLYGIERFMTDGGFTEVTKVDDRGYQIVRIPVENVESGDKDTSWYYLRMINSTKEFSLISSGTRRNGIFGGKINEDGLKEYFLRIPPDLASKEGLTTEEAVAWSFRSRVVKGSIYSNKTMKYLEKSFEETYKFKEDNREFSKQARQGDVFLRLIAESREDLLAGKLYTKDGYDPEGYSPEVES